MALEQWQRPGQEATQEVKIAIAFEETTWQVPF